MGVKLGQQGPEKLVVVIGKASSVNICQQRFELACFVLDCSGSCG